MWDVALGGRDAWAHIYRERGRGEGTREREGVEERE